MFTYSYMMLHDVTCSYSWKGHERTLFRFHQISVFLQLGDFEPDDLD